MTCNVFGGMLNLTQLKDDSAVLFKETGVGGLCDVAKHTDTCLTMMPLCS